ncbi:hypothetical protein AVEN_41151-1 [Araneus ventricosus]|uniref:Uncharacterized protein n=1 Tax=Araneus ventricosus TaxID=182803 RepID=A0A4Y2MH85_ARAVE|nr:hypothetical protein AVEN_41151-1 [Araneus ventricosus]
MAGISFLNTLHLAAISASVNYKEIVGTKIKRLDYILNLADKLRNKYVPSKTSTLSDFNPGTDDGPTALIRNSKQCQSIDAVIKL